MAKLAEIYVRKTRDELGRYPNWPINSPISLGNIGFFYGRKAEFDWRTSLADFNIHIAPRVSPSSIDELYTSLNSITFSFGVDALRSHNTAKFDFSKRMSVVTQGYNVSYHVLPLDLLEQELDKRIKNGDINWNLEWVIITELWKTESFTTLISGERNSSVEIATDRLVTSPSFNIADLSLGLKVTSSKKMGYNGIAQKNANPFFQIHKLIYDRKRNRYFLCPYGRH